MTSAPAPLPAPGPAEHLVWLSDATDRFTAALAAADLAVPVAACPGWRLAELGEHLGQVHVWARGAIVDGHPDTALPPAPADPQALAGWYREQADGLLEVLGSVDPQAPAWGFGPKPRTAAFWFRRQQHETATHLWDALVSQGQVAGYGGPGAADPVRRAADGVDEVVTTFFPRQVRLGRIPPLQRSLAVRATDADGRWLLAGDGTAPGPGDGEATVAGQAEALVLLLWGRLDLASGIADRRLTLAGDEQAASAVLGAGITP